MGEGQDIRKDTDRKHAIRETDREAVGEGQDREDGGRDSHGGPGWRDRMDRTTLTDTTVFTDRHAGRG